MSLKSIRKAASSASALPTHPTPASGSSSFPRAGRCARRLQRDRRRSPLAPVEEISTSGAKKKQFGSDHWKPLASVAAGSQGALQKIFVDASGAYVGLHDFGIPDKRQSSLVDA